jgi:hypothetical protein
MGYTQQEIDLIQRHLKGVKTVCDYGAQCLYLGNKDIRFVSDWYETRGIEYVCIDRAGDNHALKLDLSHPINIKKKFDLVVDSGTSEHIVQMESYTVTSFHKGKVNSIYPTKPKNIELGYFYAWLNKHNLLKIGGTMVNVNPMTDNWPGHGYSYLTREFYYRFVEMAGYKILETGTMAACGNTKDGWNVYSVLKKVSDEFPTFKEFITLPIWPA